MTEVTLESIQQAARRIAPYVHRTPLLVSHQLGAMFDCEIYLKCENLQKVGAFKARGAHNAVMKLTGEAAAQGVATHSSGNHAAALALAAQNRGISAHVVMPDNATESKKAAVAGYGAAITFCEPTLAAREAALTRLQSRTGAHVVHPYSDSDVVSGQGTVGLEISEQAVEEPQVVVAPVGGGGLLGGVSVAMAALQPGCAVVGAEPAGADDARRSLESGRLQPQLAPNTIADGLLTSLGAGNFELIQRHVDAVLTAPDDAIVEAMKLIWSRTKQVVEPSAAIALAVVMTHAERFRGKRVALVMSGGNVDLDRLPWFGR